MIDSKSIGSKKKSKEKLTTDNANNIASKLSNILQDEENNYSNVQLNMDGILEDINGSKLTTFGGEQQHQKVEIPDLSSPSGSPMQKGAQSLENQDEIYKGSKSNNDYSKEQLINLKESASDINFINDSQSKSTHKDLKNI